MSEGEKRFMECACSQTRKIWWAALVRQGDIWIFAECYTSQQFKAMTRVLEAARGEAVENRIADFDPKGRRQIAPPPQLALKLGMQTTDLLSSELSSFGFQCPHCGQTEYLLCLECGQISCMGKVDAAKRTICVRCGKTLVLGAGSATGAKAVRLKGVRGTVTTVEKAVPRENEIRRLQGKS